MAKKQPYIVSDRYLTVDKVRVYASSAAEAIRIASETGFMADEERGIEDYDTYVIQHYKPTAIKEQD